MLSGNNLTGKILTVLFLVSTLMFSVEAQNKFSVFNRYELSHDYLYMLNKSIDDSSGTPWFSTFNISDENYTFNFLTSGQKLGLNISTVFGYEHFKNSNRFVVLSGETAYKSKYLNGFVSVDAYTTERRIFSEVQDIQFERFIKENAHEPIDGVFDFRFNLPTAYIETNLKYLKLSVGKMKKRWGPGYKGTLGLSGTAYSPFYFYNLNLNFGNLINMEAFLCGYDDESIYRAEMDISDTIRVKSNGINLRNFYPRYGAGQRLDLRIGKHVQIGIYELVDFFGTNELSRFANPLQIYYLANESSGTNNANLLGGIDINVMVKRFRVYGEFLNDDITCFQKSGNPDKFALQLGFVFYGKDPLLQAGLEYTHVSPYVYSHSRVLSRHSHWSESMGWPWGNDQDVFTAHALFNFNKKMKGKLEVNYWMKGEGNIESDWYADGKPNLDNAPYWVQDPVKKVSTQIWYEYNPTNYLKFNVCYEPVISDKKFTNGLYCYLNAKIPGTFQKNLHVK
ncbi:MAG: hypothetical protein GXY77_05185 [Fibrobacter sp.]|nr:hypothetical protein [Fibrobacter sp.]